MNRRNFLKSGLSLSTLMLLPSNPLAVFSNPINENQNQLKIGDQIPSGVTVQDPTLQSIPLLSLLQLKSQASVLLLYIYGGATLHNPERLGGIWCPDTFEDLHILRYIHNKYENDPVDFLPVACPAVYSSRFISDGKRIFLDLPDTAQEFKENASAFVEKTEQIVADGLIPVNTYYDVRFRLLLNKEKDLPGEAYGPVYDWQGMFRAEQETQTYSTPTLWLIDSQGTVLEEPFWGNVYHSEPYQIRYTISDVDQAVARNL